MKIDFDSLKNFFIVHVKILKWFIFIVHNCNMDKGMKCMYICVKYGSKSTENIC